jgi:hypothetical protein
MGESAHDGRALARGVADENLRIALGARDEGSSGAVLPEVHVAVNDGLPRVETRREVDELTGRPGRKS